MKLVKDHIFEGLYKARTHIGFVLLAQVAIGCKDKSEFGRSETVDATKGQVFQ